MQNLDITGTAEGSGEQGGCGGPRKLGNLFIIVQVTSPSWPKIARIILSVRLSFLRCFCRYHFARSALPSSWRAPRDSTVLLPAFRSSFFHRWSRRADPLLSVCLRAVLRGPPRPVPVCGGAAGRQTAKGTPASLPSPPPEHPEVLVQKRLHVPQTPPGSCP